MIFAFTSVTQGKMHESIGVSNASLEVGRLKTDQARCGGNNFFLLFCQKPDNKWRDQLQSA